MLDPQTFASHEQILALLRTILERTYHMELRIMSRLSDQIAANQAALGRMQEAFTGLAGDIRTLKDQIAALQAAIANDTVSAETQAAMDAVTSGIAAMADSFAALDAETPAAPPVEPPPGP